ncbi:hypothetical protein C8Q80DRAFT_1271177 [Daedaleopsis nitida]|nr:hypothetical protein C8Q80DRAFT_1271177 [Daedaleopsis nitida]
MAMADNVVPKTSSNARKRRPAARRRVAFSSGRGGAGNVRKASADGKGAPPPSEPIAPVRENIVDAENAAAPGRCGHGNITSAAQVRVAGTVPENHPQTAALVLTHAANIVAYERNVIAQNEEFARILGKSSGRGGSGNIKSPSTKPRPRSRSFKIRASRRGGKGKLQGVDLNSEVLAHLTLEEKVPHEDDDELIPAALAGPLPECADITIRSGSSSPVPDLNQSRSESRRSSKSHANRLSRMLNKVRKNSAREESTDSRHATGSVAENGETVSLNADELLSPRATPDSPRSHTFFKSKPKKRRPAPLEHTSLHASSASLFSQDSEFSGRSLEFVTPSLTEASNSSVSSISLLPPPSCTVSLSVTASGTCQCDSCLGASTASSSATSVASTASSPRSSPTPSLRRNSPYMLLFKRDPWSYRSAKARIVQQHTPTISVQTLPTVDENSEHVSFIEF